MGLLPLYKAPGERSTGCVSLVRRLLGGIKVGHAGTLDSPAEGVLLLLTESSTRLSDYAMALPKEYVVRMALGVRTTTDDAAGEILSQSPVPMAETVFSALRQFIPSQLGHRQQTPPQISAVHVEGQRAHTLSRKGCVAPIAPRTVFISSIQILPPQSAGMWGLRVSCHKGTYIRSLVRDFGEFLGCGAHVAKLERCRLGPFSGENALRTEALRSMAPEDIQKALSPNRVLAASFCSYDALGGAEEALQHGRPVPFSSLRRRTWGMVMPPPFIVHLSQGLALGDREFRESKPWFVPKALVGKGAAL